MSDVAEATSSQERGSSESRIGDVPKDGRRSRSLSLDEAQRRSLEANQRVDAAQALRSRSSEMQLAQVAAALETMPPAVLPMPARPIRKTPSLPSVPDCLEET